MAIVYVAINTNGFKNPDVLQIAAKCGTRELNLYVWSDQNIHHRAAEANLMSWEDEGLYHNGRAVYPHSADDAIAQFVSFVRRCGGEYNEDVVLASHNANFDAPIILNLAYNFEVLEELTAACQGYADTLPFFREHCPYETSHSLSSLVEKYAPYYVGELHSSLKKVRALGALMYNLHLPTHKLFWNTYASPFCHYYPCGYQ